MYCEIVKPVQSAVVSILKDYRALLFSTSFSLPLNIAYKPIDNDWRVCYIINSEANIKRNGDNTMYNYHGLYNFSEKEMQKICGLTKKWAVGDNFVAVDMRGISKQVKEWAVNWNLLEMRDNRFYITSCLSYNNTSGCIFSVGGLPIEAIWRLVQPMLREDGTTGHSIVNNKLWMDNLGIAPQNDKFATDRDLQEKEHILFLLDVHHYIYFHMSGSAWSICRDERAAA